MFRLIGKSKNTDAIGARIRINTNGLTQTSEVISVSSYLVSNDIRLHFGLGNVDVVEEVNIRWPDGSEQILNNIPARQILTLEQPENLEQTRQARSKISLVPTRSDLFFEFTKRIINNEKIGINCMSQGVMFD